MMACLTISAVADDKPGLAENAHHVFVAAEIHTGFPPDTGIHLGQERRGHIPEVHAPEIDGSRKPCDVTDDASAHPDDEDRPIRFHLYQLLENMIQGDQGFCLFTGPDGDHVSVQKSFPVQVPDDAVGDDYHTPVRGNIIRQPVQRFADVNFRPALAPLYAECFHQSGS